MSKQIRLNAFNMNCVGHIHHGLWKHPRDNSVDYNKPDYWIELAQLPERGLFDNVFLADIVGVYDVLGDGIDVTAREAVQLPVNEPTYVIPLMAHATRHLGFGVTCNLTYEYPYLFARRMATLDHLTMGRLAWNIVTGYLDSAARGVGLKQQIDHDDRYDRGDDFLAAFYKLLEGSWEDGAVLADRVRATYAGPARIHRVFHDGPYYKVDGVYNLTEPSPQRTPVLFQAGASQRGKRFAGSQGAGEDRRQHPHAGGRGRAALRRHQDFFRPGTAASRNPAILRERVIGDYYLNGAVAPVPMAATPERASAAERN